MDKLEHWNNLSEKLPKINSVVAIMNKDFKDFHLAKLKVYTTGNKKINPKSATEEPDLKEGDIYWDVYVYSVEQLVWMRDSFSPYWMELEDLLKIVAPNTTTLNNTDRFEMLDIREENAEEENI